MNRITHSTPTCQVIRSAESYEGKQGPTYMGAISRESVGARGIWFGTITVPPGARTKAHLHQGHETAMVVVSGEAEFWYGHDLEEYATLQAGDYLYIPAGIPHVAGNRSSTEPVVAIAARTDPAEQESVVLRPDLEERAAATGINLP